VGFLTPQAYFEQDPRAAGVEQKDFLQLLREDMARDARLTQLVERCAPPASQTSQFMQ
jgi:hypothetical protein